MKIYNRAAGAKLCIISLGIQIYTRAAGAELCIVYTILDTNQLKICSIDYENDRNPKQNPMEHHASPINYADITYTIYFKSIITWYWVCISNL